MARSTIGYGIGRFNHVVQHQAQELASERQLVISGSMSCRQPCQHSLHVRAHLRSKPQRVSPLRSAPFAAAIPGDSAVEQVLTTGFSSFLWVPMLPRLAVESGCHLLSLYLQHLLMASR